MDSVLQTLVRQRMDTANIDMKPKIFYGSSVISFVFFLVSLGIVVFIASLPNKRLLLEKIINLFA